MMMVGATSEAISRGNFDLPYVVTCDLFSIHSFLIGLSKPNHSYDTLPMFDSQLP